ncbi:MAG TPA: SIMPL domain-containing protein [Intrasporangiaceae bacterium]|nr:SIMPL domain-containing protein [Intrasporangiaceae bacterium]
MGSILPSCVDVTGIGTASAAPDLVNLDLRVTRDGTSVAATLHAVDDVVRAIRVVLRDAGIPDSVVATTSTGIHQRYDDQGRQSSGFTGFHTLRVGVSDLDRLNSIVEATVAAGGDAVLIDGITLSIADPAPLLTLARERAFADARARAEEYAGFAGRSLGEVIWIGDSVAAPEPRMYAMRAQADEAGLSIAPGESTVTAQVSVRWAWSDDQGDHGDDTTCQDTTSQEDTA